MAIEFRCPNCDKKLRTGDDKAGLAAKCPQCGTSVTVPSASTAAEDELATSRSDDPAAPPVPRTAGQIVCPMCGAQNDAAAARCYACGEDLFGRAVAGRVPPRGFRDVWRAAWDKWTSNFGINIAAALIAAVFWVAGYVAFFVVMMIFGVGFAAAFQDDDDAGAFMVLAMLGIGYLLFFALYSLLLTGLSALALDQTRRYEVGLGALFGVFGKLGPALVGTFLSSLGLTVAMLPGIGLYVGGVMMAENENMIGVLLALLGYAVMLVGWGVGWTLFWPVHYMIVDRPGAWISPVVDGVKLAVANFKLSLLMSLTHAGLLTAGFFTCYVGLLFAMPLSFLLFAVAYDRCERAARAEAAAGNAERRIE